MKGQLKKFQKVIIGFVFLIYLLLMTQKINLVTSDLGRHLKNGEAILSRQTKVLTTNFYSYTYSEYPFLNHHWGSGVIFYLINKVFGFAGVSLFFTIISLLTFLLFFLVAWKQSMFGTTAIVSLFVIPVIVSRVEIRPEAFSYFFSGVFLFFLRKSGELRDGKKKRKWLWFLPVLEILWVNLHIYFFLGPFLIGIFFLEELFLLFKRGRFLNNLSHLSYLGGILCLSTFASLINPAGLRGVLYPLQIFKGYGYRLLENQSVWFLDKIVKYPPNIYFKISFGVLVFSWILVLVKKKRVVFSNLIFSVFFSYLSWTAVRNFSLFGLFVIPTVASNLQEIFGKKTSGESFEFFLVPSLGSLLILGLFLIYPEYWVQRINFGLGPERGVEKAALFFNKENLEGPVFNNYDIGGYLIYYLYPKEKVFVDNRPEAYPKEFFENVYIPMQEQEEIWEKTDQKYNFNSIFFYRHDMTPWSQTFLIDRISDPSWVPVYVDDYSIIFLKRNKVNEELIKTFELPKEMFSIRK